MPTLSRDQVKREVLRAWRAEHLAFAAAARAADPEAPALSRTAINPLLDQARAALAAEKKAGYVARGIASLDNPSVVRLAPWPRPTTATVRACVHGKLILVDEASGRPAPGLAGRITWNREITTLTYVTGLGWVASANDVRESRSESVCAP